VIFHIGTGRQMTISITTPHASWRLAAFRVGSLAARALVAVALIVANSANLSSTPSAIAMVEAVGVGQWLRHLAALAQVAGAAMPWLALAAGVAMCAMATFLA
jgi:hypothetical protein